MRRNLPWFLLAASMALNIFFVAGVFYPQIVGYHHPHPWDDPMAQVVEEFSLDDSQVAALEQLRNRIAERRENRSDDRGSFRTLILDAASAPTFDRDELAQALEARRREGFGDFILDLAEDLHGFVSTLSPEQKTAFLERAQDRDFLRRLLFPQRPGDGRDG